MDSQTAAQPSYEVDGAPIKRFVKEKLIGQVTKFKNSLLSVKDDLLSVSYVTADLKEDDALATLRAQYEKIIELQCGIGAQEEALERLSRKYKPAEELQPTNFEATLQTVAERALPAARLKAAGVEQLRHFDQETGATGPRFGSNNSEVAKTEGGVKEEEEEEDLGYSNTDLLHLKCPISAKAILNVQNPVEDEKGYVYEKEDIVRYIRTAQFAPVPCPIQGTTHHVSEDKLRKSNKVIRASRQYVAQKREGQGGGLAQGERDQGDRGEGGRGGQGRGKGTKRGMVYDADELAGGS